MSKKFLCEKYEPGESYYGNTIGEYLAAVRVADLPQRAGMATITKGYAVGVGSWFFCPDLPPALALGRAARASFDCRGYGAYEARHLAQWCPVHLRDERVLLVGQEVAEHGTDVELEMLDQFVRSASTSSRSVP